jgi:hypothetical protein
MPKSKVRKKGPVQPDRPVLEDDFEPPSLARRIQAFVGAGIAVLIVLSMLISAILPFINWR